MVLALVFGSCSSKHAIPKPSIAKEPVPKGKNAMRQLLACLGVQYAQDLEKKDEDEEDEDKEEDEEEYEEKEEEEDEEKEEDEEEEDYEEK